MILRRWLLALAVVTGLLAMHGITAATASASAPCGTAVRHEHVTPSPSDLPTGDRPTAQQASPAAPLAGHLGAMCLAILVGGLVVGLLVRRSMRGGPSDERRPRVPGTPMTGRAPPDPLLPLLCVSRT